MKLIVLGSSSKGNGYILTTGEEALIIECGVPFSAAQKALNFNVSSVVGILVSHRHGDHAKYLPDYAKLGVKVFAGEDVLSGNENGVTIDGPMCKTSMGGFNVVAFEVAHDVPTHGFHIQHPDMGNTLFLTDTYLCEYVFPDLSNILIEANFSDEILRSNLQKGITPRFVADRVWESHMEIETTKEVLKAHDLTKLVNIVLIHLSDHNSDADMFEREISGIAGRPVHVARKGLTLNLSSL